VLSIPRPNQSGKYRYFWKLKSNGLRYLLGVELENAITNKTILAR
jgi:hypothetical protein